MLGWNADGPRRVGQRFLVGVPAGVLVGVPMGVERMMVGVLGLKL